MDEVKKCESCNNEPCTCEKKCDKCEGECKCE